MTEPGRNSDLSAAPLTTIIELPFPPSANNLFRNATEGRKPSAHYERWRRDAGWLLAAQHPTRHLGQVTVAVDLKAPPDGKRRDADNHLKALLDLLVSHQVIERDDHTIVRKVSACWAGITDNFPGVALVTITAAS